MQKDDLVAGSNDDAMSAAWVGGQAENFSDFLPIWLGTCRFPDMYRATIAALHCGRDALLTRQRFAHRIPSVVDSLGFELQADRMHEMISQHADEQMAFHATFHLMINRA